MAQENDMTKAVFCIAQNLEQAESIVKD